MVVLNKIYTRTGDAGLTALGTGERVPKYSARIAAYGTVDETNACIGMARLQLAGAHPEVDAMLGSHPERSFRSGRRPHHARARRRQRSAARRCASPTPRSSASKTRSTRSMPSSQPLRSFVLPGGSPAAAALHVARTVCRRAERAIVELAALPDEPVSAPALKYINRLSDLLFVASRYVNARAQRRAVGAGAKSLSLPPVAGGAIRKQQSVVFIPLSDDNPLRSIASSGSRSASSRPMCSLSCGRCGKWARHPPPALPWFPPSSSRCRLSAGRAHGPLDTLAVPEGYTLLTYMFLHGDIIHLCSNMLFLWVFGDNVEDAMGHLKYLLFYVVCGVLPAAGARLMLPTSQLPLIGASGAVAGVIAAYLILHPRVLVWVLAFRFIPLHISAAWVLGVWVATQLIMVLVNQPDQVAWWAHIGGMVAGRDPDPVHAPAGRAAVRPQG